METYQIIIVSIVALLLIIWWVYRTIRISLCCGTCGCNLISEEQKKKVLAKRAKKEMKKCGSCPNKKG